MAEDFGVEDRGHFYDPVGALRDVVVNHLMQVVAAAAMEPPSGHGHETLRTPRWRCSARSRRRSRPLRPRPVRRLPGHRRRRRRTRPPRRISRCGSTSTTGAGRASRSTSGPASGSRSPRPSCGSSSGSRRRFTSGWAGDDHRPARDEFVVKLDPSTGARLIVDAHRADAKGREPSPWTWSSPRGRRRGHAVRGAAARRHGRADARGSSARTRWRSTGGSCSRCSTTRPRCTPTRPGAWGPPAAMS